MATPVVPTPSDDANTTQTSQPQPHGLLELKLLSEGLQQIELQRLLRRDGGTPAAECDRDAAQDALLGVIIFLEAMGSETGSLLPLLVDLDALGSGAKPSPMLKPKRVMHRRVDAPVIEGVKGRLAAIVAYRQEQGATRKDALAWVARNVSSSLKLRLGTVSVAALDSWLVKWGGATGATPGPGRQGYLAVQVLLRKRVLSDEQLKGVFKALALRLAERSSPDESSLGEKE